MTRVEKKTTGYSSQNPSKKENTDVKQLASKVASSIHAVKPKQPVKSHHSYSIGKTKNSEKISKIFMKIGK